MMNCRGFAPYSEDERACLCRQANRGGTAEYPSLKDSGGFFIAIFEGG